MLDLHLKNRVSMRASSARIRIVIEGKYWKRPYVMKMIVKYTELIFKVFIWDRD
jgi:hypothetical protein